MEGNEHFSHSHAEFVSLFFGKYSVPQKHDMPLAEFSVTGNHQLRQTDNVLELCKLIRKTYKL